MTPFATFCCNVLYKAADAYVGKWVPKRGRAFTPNKKNGGLRLSTVAREESQVLLYKYVQLKERE